MLERTNTVPAPSGRYVVQLPVFEGPLDLLLHLIEREELDITRVSLTLVTDQYLGYLRALEQLSVNDLADFVVVAARLLLIKSQALLPRPSPLSPSEGVDAAEQLLEQLRAYRAFKEAARRLEERSATGLRSYVRLAPYPHLDTGIEHLEPVSLDSLLVAAHRALQVRSDTRSANDVVPPFSLTIEDQIELITQTLREQARVSFSELLTSAYSRYEVVVTLLALLELVKQRRILAYQERVFGDIALLRLA